MTYLKLTGKLLRNTGLSAILLIIMMFLSQFGLLYLEGSFAMPRLYENALDSLSGVGDYCYFSLGSFGRDDETLLLCENLRQKIEQTEITEAVCYASRIAGVYGEKEMDLWAISPICFEKISSPKMLSGGIDASGIAPGNESQMTSPETLELIAVGDTAKGHALGDCFSITTVTAIGRTVLPVRLSGTFSGSVILPFFPQDGSHLSAYELFSERSDLYIILQTPQTEAVFSAFADPGYIKRKGILFFREGTEEAEKQLLISELKNEGVMIQTAAEIKQNTQDRTKTTLKDQIGLPLLCMWLSFFSTIVIVLLLADRQLYDLSVYFLLGLSKKRGYWLLPVVFSFLNAAAMIPNLLIVAFADTGGEGILQNVRFSGTSIWLLFAHFLFFAAVILLEGFLILRKKSFLDIKNREWK